MAATRSILEFFFNTNCSTAWLRLEQLKVGLHTTSTCHHRELFKAVLISHHSTIVLREGGGPNQTHSKGQKSFQAERFRFKMIVNSYFRVNGNIGLCIDVGTTSGLTPRHFQAPNPGAMASLELLRHINHPYMRKHAYAI